MTRISLSFLSAAAAAVLASAPLMAAQAQSPASRLFEQMKMDAQTIDSHASTLASLTGEPNAGWGQFDRQWNEIKPAQEDLQMNFDRLEGMRATLSDQQRKELDQSKAAIENIGARTHGLYQSIDKQGADLSSRQFRSQTQALKNEAAEVVRTS